MKSSGIGGQAVLEGVMMKNKDQYAVAVRKPDGEIAVEIKEFKSFSEKHPQLKLPIIRGVVAFIESLTIGIKTLTFSASFYEEDEENKTEKESSKMSEKVSNFLIVLFSVCLSVGVFIVLPYFISQFLGKKIESQALLSLLEGVIRILLFVGYVGVISQMKDIKRVFMYHGAEHKTINCIENGYELTVRNVKRQSAQHKRCGTSFMLIVMFVSILFFIFIRVETPWLRLLLRLLLVPVIAGVSYEFIKLAGRSESKLVNILSKPGMLMQRLTTKEPDEEMIQVAIQSVEAVFDWKSYLEENAPKKAQKRNSSKKKSSGKETIQVSSSTTNVKSKLEVDTVTMKKSDASEVELTQELDNLDKLLENKSIELVDTPEQKQSNLKEKVRVQDQNLRTATAEISASLEPCEEEEDVILKALDKFFVFGNQKNVTEFGTEDNGVKDDLI